MPAQPAWQMAAEFLDCANGNENTAGGVVRHGMAEKRHTVPRHHKRPRTVNGTRRYGRRCTAAARGSWTTAPRACRRCGRRRCSRRGMRLRARCSRDSHRRRSRRPRPTHRGRGRVRHRRPAAQGLACPHVEADGDQRAVLGIKDLVRPSSACRHLLAVNDGEKRHCRNANALSPSLMGKGKGKGQLVRSEPARRINQAP